MKQSESIAELAKALTAAQAQITNARADSTNPHFRSKYADLASCWDACRRALTDNKLSIVQSPETEGSRLHLTTTLLHESGEWMSSTLSLTSKQDTPQAIGSALTYARRYALAAMVGIAQDDDDGNSASKPDPFQNMLEAFRKKGIPDQQLMVEMRDLYGKLCGVTKNTQATAPDAE